jgi:thiol:disulfide interchange protein DsbD
MKTMIALKRLVALLVLVIPPALALDSVEQDLLKPDQAFRFSADLVNPATIQVNWDIADGYYLYRDRIRFSTDTPGIELGEAELPPGQIKNDEFFGKLAIYRNQAVVKIPVTRSKDAPGTLKLSAVSQGCADIGVCFPPHTQLAELALPAASPAASNTPESLSDTLGLGAAGDEQFLDADEAFRVSVTPERPDLLLVRWDIADGYYLYRDKFKVKLTEGNDVTLGSPSLPPGETKHDEFFGDVQIFHHEAEMRVPLKRTSSQATDITLQVAYQGCAEAGICYPPIKKMLPVRLPALDAETGVSASTAAAEGPAGASPATPGVTSRQDDIARIYRLHVSDDTDPLQHHRRAGRQHHHRQGLQSFPDLC